MVDAIFMQAAMTLIAVVIAALVGGFHAAVSACIGGLACLVPNALFGLRLFFESRRPGGATVQGVFIGEFAKLAATVAILFVAARAYRDLHWLALIVSLIAVLNSYLLVFFFARNRA